jgi:hypothetical protein
MKISQEVKEYADIKAHGMKEMSGKFEELGSSLYHASN